MRDIKRACRRSFSLFEVLIAIALLITLLSTMFGVLFQVSDTRTRVIERSMQLEATTILMERLEFAMMTCQLEGPSGEAGVVGDATSLAVIASGTVIDLADADAWASDRQRYAFAFDPSTKQLLMSRTVLPSMSIAPNVPIDSTFGDVRFRYHDGTAWRETFNSLQAGRLPKAIEVAVWFRPWRIDFDVRFPDGAEEESFIPEREKFDATGGFDEFEFALESDTLESEAPVPDRLRVLIVPDSEPDDGAISDDAFVPGLEDAS
jgi:type II secretory pathway pseudopilin PulG